MKAGSWGKGRVEAVAVDVEVEKLRGHLQNQIHDVGGSAWVNR